MKLNQADENILKNLRGQKSWIIIGYLILGISGLGFILTVIKPGALISAVLYLSGLITGLAIEKLYSRKIYSLCLKLYAVFRAK